MKKEEYRLHARLEGKNWWFVTKRKNIRQLFEEYVKIKSGMTLLDIGCGTGMNSEIFGRKCLSIGLDISSDALKYCGDKEYKYLICGDGTKLPIRDSFADIIIASDTLEHLDDSQALGAIRRISKLQGLFIVTVPAYSFLWTSRDNRLGHMRRYTASKLKIELNRNGFFIKKMTYINMFLLPFLYLKAVSERYFKPLHKDREEDSIIIVNNFFNKLLIGFFTLERFLWRYFDCPCGTSILCIAEKIK